MVLSRHTINYNKIIVSGLVLSKSNQVSKLKSKIYLKVPSHTDRNFIKLILRHPSHGKIFMVYITCMSVDPSLEPGLRWWRSIDLSSWLRGLVLGHVVEGRGRLEPVWCFHSSYRCSFHPFTGGAQWFLPNLVIIKSKHKYNFSFFYNSF